MSEPVSSGAASNIRSLSRISRPPFVTSSFRFGSRAGDATGAARAFEQAEKTAAAIEGTSRRVEALRKIAGEQLAARDAKGAVHTLDQALDAAARGSVEDYQNLYLHLLKKKGQLTLLC
jgi:hypothetical protein